MYKGVGKASCTGSSVCLYTGEGITMDEIDQAVHQVINDNGAYPSPLGYVMGGLQGMSKAFFSTNPSGLEDDDNHSKVEIEGSPEIDDYDFLPERPELQLQGVDPKKGWNFLGVHKAIICGKVGQSLVQKILRKDCSAQPCYWSLCCSTISEKGDIETRVYNDNITGEVKSIPEICIIRNGRLQLIKGGGKCRGYFH